MATQAVFAATAWCGLAACGAASAEPRLAVPAIAASLRLLHAAAGELLLSSDAGGDGDGDGLTVVQVILLSVAAEANLAGQLWAIGRTDVVRPLLARALGTCSQLEGSPQADAYAEALVASMQVANERATRLVSVAAELDTIGGAGAVATAADGAMAAVAAAMHAASLSVLPAALAPDGSALLPAGTTVPLAHSGAAFAMAPPRLPASTAAAAGKGRR